MSVQHIRDVAHHVKVRSGPESMPRQGQEHCGREHSTCDRPSGSPQAKESKRNRSDGGVRVVTSPMGAGRDLDPLS